MEVLKTSVPLELIGELEKRFPDVAPRPRESFEDLRWRGGQVDVIRFLRLQYQAQQELNTLVALSAK